MECRTNGKVHDCHPGGVFLVFFEDHNGGVAAISGEGGDFADREFVPIPVGRATDVFGVRDEGSEELRRRVEGRIEGGGYEDFWRDGSIVRDEKKGGKFGRKGCWREGEIGRCRVGDVARASSVMLEDFS